MNAITSASPLSVPVEPAMATATSSCRRTTVTILMCDIVNSTRLSTRLPVETFRSLLLSYYAVCNGIVSRHNGMTVRYIGDGIMNVFGEPYTNGGTAFDAVRAGVHAANEKFEFDGEPYEVRMSAATGEVAVGTRIGSGPALQEAVFGIAPYVAARMQKLATPGSLVVDRRTHAEISAHFRTENLGQHQLRGFTQRQRIWKVISLKGIEQNSSSHELANGTGPESTCQV